MTGIEDERNVLTNVNPVALMDSLVSRLGNRDLGVLCSDEGIYMYIAQCIIISNTCRKAN